MLLKYHWHWMILNFYYCFISCWLLSLIRVLVLGHKFTRDYDHLFWILCFSGIWTKKVQENRNNNPFRALCLINCYLTTSHDTKRPQKLSHYYFGVRQFIHFTKLPFYWAGVSSKSFLFGLSFWLTWFFLFEIWPLWIFYSPIIG